VIDETGMLPQLSQVNSDLAQVRAELASLRHEIISLRGALDVHARQVQVGAKADRIVLDEMAKTLSASTGKSNGDAARARQSGDEATAKKAKRLPAEDS
jgi:hypothetical protein